MIELKKDLFARLAISAQKDRAINYRFRTTKEKLNFVNSEFDKKYIHKSPGPREPGTLDNVLYSIGPNDAPEAPVDLSNANVGISSTSVSTNKTGETLNKGILTKVSTMDTIARSRVSKTEKMDEKIAKIVNDPDISMLRAELEFSEELLKKIKITDTHNPKIPVIEETIFRLKKLLHEKSYF